MLALETFTLRAAEPANLVPNGDFSQTSNGRPTEWQLAGNASVTQTLRVTTNGGRRCAELQCSRYEGKGGDAHAMLVQMGKIQLVKGRTYEFSCQLRADGILGHSLAIAITDMKTWQKCGLETEFHLTDAWKTHRHLFKASRDAGAGCRFQLWFAETGTLYLADVSIVESKEQEAEFTDVIGASDGKNLVPNACFELGGSGWSSMGTGTSWGNLDHLYGQIERGGAPSGQSFLRIPVGEDRTPVLLFDYYQPLIHREIRPVAASKGWIKVVKGNAYTLSCFMRASRDDVPALLGAIGREPVGRQYDYRKPVSLNTAWKRYSLNFTPQESYLFVFAGPNLQSEERVDVDIDAIQLEKGETATEFQPWRTVELALEPSEAAGIFYDDQAGALSLSVRNAGETACHLNVQFRVTDFEDRAVAWPDCDLKVPAHTVLQRKIKIPRDWRGYYHVAASAQTEGAPLTSQVRLAIVPRRASRDSVFGINHAFGTTSLMDLASKGGVGWYRDWSFTWQHMEPAKGEFHWEPTDAQIDRVVRNGDQMMALLPPFPSANWASEAPMTVTSNGNYPASRMRQAWAPKDPRELADYIGQAVTRYKDRVHIWEFLNEPIYTDYSMPARQSQANGRNYKPADYVALLATASSAMRQADPGCKVMGGIASDPFRMTQDVLDAGILKYLDYFNLHIYPNQREPEAYAGEMDALLKNMDAHGGRKPIWITEFSYYAVDNPPRRPAARNGGEGGQLENERDCADYTARFFAVMLSHGVQKIFMHSGASGSINSPSYECALFDYGGAPRKLFPAMAVLTQNLGPSPACAGSGVIGQAGQVAAFETGRQAVLILWQSEDEPAPRLRLPSGKDMIWMDAMGRKSASPPSTLTPSLTYLLARTGSAANLLHQIAPQATP